MNEHAITPASVLAVLNGRIGTANGITAADLVKELTGGTSPADQRRLRDCVVLLRQQGHAVCALPEAGYFMAANCDELDRACRFLLDRAQTGLQQVAAMKNKAVPDLAGQLGLDLSPEGVQQ